MTLSVITKELLKNVSVEWRMNDCSTGADHRSVMLKLTTRCLMRGMQLRDSCVDFLNTSASFGKVIIFLCCSSWPWTTLMLHWKGTCLECKEFMVERNKQHSSTRLDRLLHSQSSTGQISLLPDTGAAPVQLNLQQHPGFFWTRGDTRSYVPLAFSSLSHRKCFTKVWKYKNKWPWSIVIQNISTIQYKLQCMFLYLTYIYLEILPIPGSRLHGFRFWQLTSYSQTRTSWRAFFQNRRPNWIKRTRFP